MALTRVEFDGIRYRPRGRRAAVRRKESSMPSTPAMRSVWPRDFATHRRPAMTYFGILVSSCKVMVRSSRVQSFSSSTIMNWVRHDCRGWISHAGCSMKLRANTARIFWPMKSNRLAAQARGHGQDVQLNPDDGEVLKQQAEALIDRKLLRRNRFYQFRLAFDRDAGKGVIQGYGG